MSEFIQALLIISVTAIALVAIVLGKKFSTAIKDKTGIEAELSVSEDDDNRKK